MQPTHNSVAGWRCCGCAACVAVENGYPGECEGYIPCYANIMNWLDGEYLRRHPRGVHASEVVAQVHTSLVESLKRLSGKDAESYLNSRTDCGDLNAGRAIGVIDQLLARC